MRTTALLAALVLAPALVAVGFADAELAAEAPTALVLDAHQVASADLYYDLDALALGESFAVAYRTDADVVRLRSDRTADGYALSFVAGEARPTAVTVRYLVDGEDVAAPVTFPGDAPVVAGTAASGPDSWHVDCSWDPCIIRKDYKKGGSIIDGATPFTTAAGETVAVTDVAFELHGLDLGASEAIHFETAAGVRVTAQSFGPTLR